MKKIRYSIDNIQMYLREKGIFDINEVEFAIVEDSGSISVLKKSQYQPLTPSDMNISTKYKGISTPLVIQGKVQEDNLRNLKLDIYWLEKQLKNNNMNSVEEIFYMDINSEGKLYISKEVEPENIVSILN
jgi:uncharacterized membrane protein YcaP (DUF421 family)